MKYPLLLICFISLSTYAIAQTGRTTLSTLPKLTVWLNDPHDSITLPTDRIAAPSNSLFGRFEVIDERPDTARIGVHANLPMHTHTYDRQLVLNGAADQELARYLDRYCTRPGASYTALVVLRELWLSDADPYPQETIAHDLRAERKHSRQTAGHQTHIRLKAEVYALKDSQYLPLFRIDTLQATSRVVYNTLRSTYNGWEKELADMLRQLADSASQATARKEGHSTLISREDISRFNRSRFALPIDDDAVPAMGVYTTFEEFRNNAPATRDFQIRWDNGNRTLYIKDEAGTYYYSHTAWGYSDGKAVYFMRDGILRPIWKEGKAFYFYGIDTGKKPGTGPSSSDLAQGEKALGDQAASMLFTTPVLIGPELLIGGMILAFGGLKNQRCIYTFDMDSGRIY